MNKRIVLGMILVLLILLAADAVAFLLARASSAPTEQAPVVRPSPSSVHRSQEVPFSSHRAFSMVASQAATALTPWGMALDYPHGFLWVAEPGCEPKPKCPSTFPGVVGQY